MVLVSRVFTTGISRNKEIHLKVLIEDDSKILGHPLSVFSPQDCTKSPRETEITPAAAKPAQLRVLRKRNSSGKASSDAGPELAGRAAERRWKARRP